MGWDTFRDLFWPRPGSFARPTPPARTRPGRRGPVEVGTRVRLLIPIASPHTVHIPAGAAGIVVGGNPARRQVSVELDTPRTVITVPWNWLEDEPPSPEPADSPAAPQA